jgi:hypothetical protein
MESLSSIDPLDLLPVVIPSGMEIHTPLVPLLIDKNPSLARKVLHSLNRIDRSRRELYQKVLGDIK